MSKYTGTKCIVCENIFKDGDDIVVCPECGTPYHRECWQKNGECVNTELHEKGKSWDPEYPADDEPQYSGEPLRCIRCGAENAAGTMFCVECGMPLTPGRDQSRPFNGTDGAQGAQGEPRSNENGYFDYTQPGGANTQNGANGGRFGPFGMPVQPVKLTEDSDIDGVRLGDYFDYTGRKSLNLIANFVKFSKTGVKSSMNIVALFFPQYYFFYRKMNKEGIIYMLLWFVCVIPALILYGQTGMAGVTLFKMPFDIESTAFVGIYNITQVLTTVTAIVAGLFANYWYYNQARRDIMRIRSEESDETAVRGKIREAGGTSWARVIVAITVTMGLSLAVLLILSAIF